MTYSASEVAEKLALTKDTLRYYEKEGLLPPIPRNHSGHRVYSESDIEWIFLIRSLRDTDMPIAQIKQYVSLLMSGGETIMQRRDILLAHEAFMKQKVILYQQLLVLLQKKVAFYDEALQTKDPESIKCMDYATEWTHFKAIITGGGTHD